ncbi:hypothetical protein IE077_004440 [Cardiosporidium cionae]|uniref:Uncharacterized protein n=1 Tax=Cardiosporidium cionae TaxID=476202 RepID=A0ABQ7JFJ0_9APIC|nr:hypothetical protein IE077_004440 [Cardiosporidium cionae]|eukprot:KAF8822731.1 hypothetical protein IE077_004440 [Cardiosporidium cionae]
MHWILIAAARILGFSLVKLERYNEAISVYKQSTRDAVTSNMPTLVISVNRYFLADAMRRHGTLESGRVEIVTALQDLEKCAGIAHPYSLNALFLSAQIHQALGCLELMHPPVHFEKVGEDNESVHAKGIIRAITSEDAFIIESTLNDSSRVQKLKEALSLYESLFQRLNSQQSFLKHINAIIAPSTQAHEIHCFDEKSSSKRRLQKLAVVKEILAICIMALTIAEQRAIVGKIQAIHLSQASPSYVQDLSICAQPSEQQQRVVESHTRRNDADPDYIDTAIYVSPRGLPSRQHDRITLQVTLFAPPNRFKNIADRLTSSNGSCDDFLILLNLLRIILTPLQKQTMVAQLYYWNNTTANSHRSSVITSQLKDKKRLVTEELQTRQNISLIERAEIMTTLTRIRSPVLDFGARRQFRSADFKIGVAAFCIAEQGKAASPLSQRVDFVKNNVTGQEIWKRTSIKPWTGSTFRRLSQNNRLDSHTTLKKSA